MARARGKKLSRIRAWVDDHAEGMFSGDREYSWDAIGGVIMFHTGIFKGTTIRYKGGNYEVSCPSCHLNGLYKSQVAVINGVLIPLTHYAYKEVK